MKTQFDKIYVLSLITNKDRQEFITYQFNELGLDFEFIYGLDYYNFDDIEFPNVYKFNTWVSNGNAKKNYGCTIAHYQAVAQSYYLGYNNVLIFEDDICLIKDKSLIEKMLNDIPNDIDFIDYDPRCFDVNTQNKLIDIIKVNSLNNNCNYYRLDNSYKVCGAAMYAIMNRKTMELYLNNQHKYLMMSDWVYGFYEKTSVNRYIPKYCMFVDQLTYNKVFIKNDKTYSLCSTNLYCNLYDYNENDFFKPTIFNIYSRN